MSRHSKYHKLAVAKAYKKTTQDSSFKRQTAREFAKLNAYLTCTNDFLTATNNIARKAVVNIKDLATHIDAMDCNHRNANSFLKEAEEKLDLVLRNGYAPQTNKNYGYAVQRFINFSMKCGIPEANVLPANPRTVALFIASGVGVTSESTARGNLSAIAAWHRINGFPFDSPPQLAIIKKGLRAMWPGEKQKKAVRKPISPGMVLALTQAWSGGPPQELCALGIALAAWCGIARLGELLPPSLNEVDAKRLPRRRDWSPSPVIPDASTIALPWTKTTFWKGATICLLSQKPPFNPSLALSHHLADSPMADTHLLCEYLNGHQMSVMDKGTFMSMANAVWQAHGWPQLSGHSFRIGGTTTYLRAGVDPKVVKKMGRWTSDAFLLYWRNTEEIFASHASNLSWVDFAI